MRSKVFERILNDMDKDLWWVKLKRWFVIEYYVIKCLGLIKYFKNLKTLPAAFIIAIVGSSNENDMNKEFQVEQNYGQGSKGWIYFEIDEGATEQEIINQARKVVQSDWDKQYKPRTPSILFNPQPCRPTILIKEYKDGKSVRGGIKLKTRWR